MGVGFGSLNCNNPSCRKNLCLGSSNTAQVVPLGNHFSRAGGGERDHTGPPTETAPNPPTGPELIIYLLQQCTALERLHIEGRCQVGPELESWYRILSTGLPGTITKPTPDFGVSSPLCLFVPSPDALSRCFSNLHELSLHMRYGLLRVQSELHAHGTWDDNEDESLPSLRVPRATCQIRKLCSPSLFKFLRRCSTSRFSMCHVSKNLRLNILDTDSVQLLTDELRNGLPSLDSIQIDSYFEAIPDQEMANMLSACRIGWRSINILHLGALTAEIVVEHSPTLGALTLKKASGLSSEYMLRILPPSPRFQSFVTLTGDGERNPSFEATRIFATEFIDADSSSDSLRPWACESTLKILRAKSSGIPRPDITQKFSGRPIEDGMVLSEAYPGQSQNIQGRVYERLARLTRLERLELGNDDRDWCSEERFESDYRRTEQEDDDDHQYDCLEMSLQSGLWRLEGLKELRVLGEVKMLALIGPAEEQLMKEHWSKIERICQPSNRSEDDDGIVNMR